MPRSERRLGYGYGVNGASTMRRSLVPLPSSAGAGAPTCRVIVCAAGRAARRAAVKAQQFNIRAGAVTMSAFCRFPKLRWLPFATSTAPMTVRYSRCGRRWQPRKVCNQLLGCTLSVSVVSTAGRWLLTSSTLSLIGARWRPDRARLAASVATRILIAQCSGYGSGLPGRVGLCLNGMLPRSVFAWSNLYAKTALQGHNSHTE
jgi:hypothetical protein